MTARGRCGSHRPLVACSARPDRYAGSVSEPTSAVGRRGRRRGSAADVEHEGPGVEREGPDVAVDAAASGHPEAGESTRERLEELGTRTKERFEQPINRVTTITRKTMALFPVRVWRHFLARNGFILSAGMSYQALFAIFAAVYVVFAVAGIWLTGNSQALTAFIALLNTYAPGLVGDDGIISTDELYTIATTSTSLFGWTGAVALAGLIWTAIGWITYSRIAVRSIFLLPQDTRGYVMLNTRDF